MVKNNNIIEINGQRYDATTGAVVSESGNDTTQRSNTGTAVSQSDQKKSAAKSRPVQSTSGSKQQAKPTAKLSKPAMHDIVRRPVADISGHSPERPKTLMRSSVQKPKAGFKYRIKSQTRVDDFITQPSFLMAPKLLADSVDNQRLKHARVIPKSQLISHYNFNEAHTPVMPPVISETPLIARRKAPVAANPHPQTTSELLQLAVAQATSHEQPPVKPSRAPRYRRRSGRRILGASTAVLALVLMSGVVIHQNMPNIKLDLASSKAGFTASLPGNQPAGYSLANLNYSTGQVALYFHSNSDDSRAYALTERTSNWDSATLRDMYVNEATEHFQTIDAGGQILYLFGQQNITWVNGGIWYQVQSAGSLSNQQLINIATSI